VAGFVIRVSPRDRLPTDPEVVLLDWFADQRAASTVQTGPRFLHGLTPDPAARDFLQLAGAAYCADKLVLRRLTEDRWTRQIHLDVPVADLAR
jgi:hypothetical protein